jgi:hypothetical protein
VQNSLRSQHLILKIIIANHSGRPLKTTQDVKCQQFSQNLNPPWLNSLKRRPNKISYFYYLNGQCHEIFDPQFFHQTIPPRALIHGLKSFCIWLRFRHFMTKIFNFIYVFSVVYCRSRITFHVGSRSVSAVSMRPRNQFPRSQ